MPRATTRPSDMYRLPDDVRQSPQRVERAPEPRYEPPSGRMGKTAIVAAALVVAVVTGSSTFANNPRTSMADVPEGEEAVAALALYHAQAATIDELRTREDIFASPGATDAAAVVARGLAEVQRTLRDARAVTGADPLAAGYWKSGAHGDYIEEVQTLHEHTRTMALLAATQDMLDSGTGSITIAEAREELMRATAKPVLPLPLREWADGLLQQIDGGNPVDATAQAREAAASLWGFQVRHLEPASVPLVHNYASRLPDETINALRDHPVAGAAIELLERDRGPIT